MSTSGGYMPCFGDGDHFMPSPNHYKIGTGGSYSNCDETTTTTTTVPVTTTTTTEQLQ